MEDYIKIVSNYRDVPGSGFYAIFDGHAGSKAAEWCANNLSSLLDNTLAIYAHHWPMPNILAHTFEEADKKISSQLDYDNSGTTAAVAYIETKTDSSFLIPADPSSASSTYRRQRHTSFHTARTTPGLASKQKKIKRTLYTANVGDSRIVLCRNGLAKRLTVDHKASDPLEKQRIRQAGGEVKMGRVAGNLELSRALGDMEFKPYVSPRPYYSEIILDAETDEFIIIACDGVWDVCSDQAAVDLIRDVENTKEASQKIVRTSLLNGSMDNISCLVVRLRPPPTNINQKSLHTYTDDTGIYTFDTLQLKSDDVRPEFEFISPATIPRRLLNHNAAAAAVAPGLEIRPMLLGSSPTESDTTISEEDDIDQLSHFRRTYSRRSASFSIAHRPRLSTSPGSSCSPPGGSGPGKQFHEDTESTLDRFGRFKVVRTLDFSETGDDCAIADSD